MKLRDLFSDDAMIDPQAEAVAVSGLAVDSRAVKPGDLFFALTGHKTDGARFIDSAVSSGADRKSTRLNSSHSQISYAVFCLKNKNIYVDHSYASNVRAHAPVPCVCTARKSSVTHSIRDSSPRNSARPVSCFALWLLGSLIIH